MVDNRTVFQEIFQFIAQRLRALRGKLPNGIARAYPAPAERINQGQQSVVHDFAAESGAISPLQRKVGIAFGIALVAIISIGSLQYRTVHQLNEDNRRVLHNQDVLGELEAFRTSLNRADAFAQSFVATGDNSYLTPYTRATVELRERLQALRTLTISSAIQQQRVGTLEGLASKSVRALEAETEARKTKGLSLEKLLQLEHSIRKSSGEVHAVTGEMQTEELKVLRDWRKQAQRAHQRTSLLILFGTILACFLLVVAGIGLQLNLAKRGKAEASRIRAYDALQCAKEELEREIKAKAEAQVKLQDSERSLRQLSLDLLKTQDEERRRIGRELHDSVGQYLAVLKIGLDSLRKSVSEAIGSQRAEQELGECVALTDETIKEVRTMSYLLHPPLLEAFGLKSAIPWYVEGFSKRSGIHITLDILPDFDRLPDDVELAIFRVLQESLTNVHRHSGSPTAHVRLLVENGVVTLEISDRGKGIPPEQLAAPSGLPSHSTLGVGLQSMKERMRQLGGKLEMNFGAEGTTIRAAVPQCTTTSAKIAHA